MQEYANLDETGDLTRYLFEENMSDGDIEVRFFPTPENGPVKNIYFEIKVFKTANWHESLGSYGPDNLRNVGEVYKALASELESCVNKSLGKKPDFVVNQGSTIFSAEVSV